MRASGFTLTMHNSTLSGNSAVRDGGGIWAQSGTLWMLNSTLSGNSAVNYGGGINFHDSVELKVGNSIVAGNKAPYGKEIFRQGAYFTDQGHNLFGENGASGLLGATPRSDDLILAGPIGTAIGPLTNNGGPTLTHHPVANSPVINAGDNVLVAANMDTDQRGAGFPRIVNGTVDIGAVELRPTYALTVNKTGGNGLVTSTPTGINCGATCSASFGSGAKVTLTAKPDTGYSFTSWLGDCTGAALTCTLTMTVAKSVTALFSNTVTKHTLTVQKAGNGTGTVASNPAGIACGTDCTQSYNQGTSVTLTATPAAGSKFAGWSGACAGVGACVVSMTAAKTVTATFIRPVLTVRKVGSGLVATAAYSSGIFCGPDCTETYSLNARVTLVAIPALGRRFVGWTGCAANASFPPLCTVTMNQSKVVVATFQ